jgi:dUTPase
VSNKVQVLYKTSNERYLPEKGRDGDFAYDLRSAEDVLVIPSTFASYAIGTGLRTAFNPYEHGMRVTMRGGVAKKTPLLIPNSDGTIEGTYRDEIKVLMRNTFIGNFSVDYCFGIDGKRMEVKDIPKHVLRKAKDEYMAEMKKITGATRLQKETEETLFKTKVPVGSVFIAKGDRFAQMYLMEAKELEFVKQEGKLPDSVRGNGAWGSSGTT